MTSDFPSLFEWQDFDPIDDLLEAVFVAVVEKNLFCFFLGGDPQLDDQRDDKSNQCCFKGCAESTCDFFQ